MKVFLFSTQWPEYMVELANALSSMCSVILMVPENHRFTTRHKELVNDQVCLEQFHVVFHKSIRQNFKMIFHILTRVWRYKPDILHIQANGHRLFFWILLFKPRGTKVINTIHDPEKHTGDRLAHAINDDLVKWIGRFFIEKYIVHAKTLREKLQIAYKLHTDRIVSIPHGNFEIYKKFQVREGIEEGNTVLFFGRIWEYKGLQYFIEAANLITPINPKIAFSIIGFGEDLRRYTDRILFPEKFKIVNMRVSIEEAGVFFQESSIVVLPYVEATQSGVIPVAYAYGKPVVASNVGGLPEMVIDGVTGFLVKPRSAVELANRILHLMEDKETRRRMSLAANRFAQDKLSWKKIASLTFKVYESVR